MKIAQSLSLVLLATAVPVALHAQGTQTAKAGKTTGKVTHRVRQTKKAAGPTTAQQIQELREQMQSQMQDLRNQLSAKDAQVQAAQSAAQAAQASADAANQQAKQATEAASSNNSAVTDLNGAVTDLKTNTSQLSQTLQDDQKATQKALNEPNVLHYKGITLTPVGFAAAETAFRNRGTGAEISTPFASIPVSNSDLAKQTEFFGTGRQSRIGLLAEGKEGPLTMRAYYESDWLGVGTSSNNNQSNSYVLRQRQAFAQAEIHGYTFTGGQQWSLATETAKGLNNRTEVLPMTIDPNYSVGFVWARQYGFRVTKNFNDHFWLGVSAENPQILAPVINGSTTNLPLFLYATPGVNGGLYNAGASTTNGTTPGLLTSYGTNPAPDFILKAAMEPKFGGHYEVFGISRFFRDRIYPNVTAATIAAGTSSSALAYNDVAEGAGIGGGAKVPTLHKHLDLGLKGLWGQGVGRYGASQIADVTVKPTGHLSPLHGFSALSTVEWHATPRADVYFNYGGDYIQRSSHTNPSSGLPLGYGVGLNNSGCRTEPVPGNTNTTTTGTPPVTVGTGGGTTFPANPARCSAVNKDVQELTLGYWYDFYKGAHGRLRQGLQYSYIERKFWQDTTGVVPNANLSLFETSFRYYLP